MAANEKSAKPTPEREAKLAQALRANLHRRKAAEREPPKKPS